jgi:GTP-binding protein
MFCDKAEIFVSAGKGGDGGLSFLHEKYREFGGPDGGDGGDGGSVILRVDFSWNTLYYYKTNRKIVAENGEQGKGRKKHGRNGEDLFVPVPVGTVIFDSETNKQIADLSEIGAEFVIAKGGEGGFGNSHFRTSTRQTPKFAELGTPGEEKNIRLELKLIADVGLVGLPNIGKSTLLSVVSSARPKVADYPFTTIIPNLGVVDGYGMKGFVIADMPGLIAGAAQGKGLGDEFLKHIERTRVIIHILKATSEDLKADFDTINKELTSYSKDVANKPQILAISQIDLIDETTKTKVLKTAKKIITDNPKVFKYDKKPYLFSSITKEGVRELLLEADSELAKIPKKIEKKAVKVFTLADAKRSTFTIIPDGESLVVKSERLEKFVTKTDFSNPHAVMRIYDIMTRMGITKELAKRGAHLGTKVKILDKELEYKG